MRDASTLVVDTREIEAFGAAHVRGALNIALREEFPVWSGWMLKPEQRVLLVLAEEADLDEVQRHLLRIGIENVGGFLRRGMRGWLEAGMPFQTLPQLSVQELHRNLEAWQILDVRKDDEWKAGHIQGAQHKFVPQLHEIVEELHREKPLAVYCGSGYRASIAASWLQACGFQKVHNIPGSIKAWKANNYELVEEENTKE